MKIDIFKNIGINEDRVKLYSVDIVKLLEAFVRDKVNASLLSEDPRDFDQTIGALKMCESIKKYINSIKDKDSETKKPKPKVG